MGPPTKRRKKDSNAVEEVVFDASARADYLTGFHKRKLQRIKRAREEAVKREKAEKVTERKRLREQRKEDLKNHVEAVNAMLQRQQTDRDTSDDSGSEANDDEQGWTGFSESEDDKSAAPVDREDEYLDEDRYTTVTVESVDITKSGLQKAVPADAGEDSTSGDAGGEGGVVGRRLSTPSAKPKVRKKKFRYLSKGDRKAVRMKERSGNRARAKARRE